MKEKITLNERKSRIALILVLTILMQILMPIFTGTSKVYAVTQYRVIGSATDTPSSLPSDFKEVTLEEATAYGQSFTDTVAWLIIYARDGSNYKFVKYSPEMPLYNGTQTWDNIIYGESYCYHDPEQVSIIIPYGGEMFNVKLNTNGGTINSGNITEYEKGIGATLPTDVTKDGYTFEGWFASSDFSGGAVTEISTTEKGDKKYWAKWTSVETTEELLTTITATGKEQASYSPENVATVSFSYSSQGSSAYFASWGWWGYGWTATVTPADGYTITKCVFYDDKDRTATDSEAPFVVETTEEDKTPKVNGTPILAYQSKGITKIEVYGYANPTTVTSTITLNTNGGTINTGKITEYEEGTGATLPIDVTKDGYTFDGWYDNEDKKITVISASETGNKEYWAKWTPATYTVKLNTNNGTINSGNVTSYTYGTETTLPTDVTRTDYTFDGWYANAELTGDKVTSISNTATGNKEYWAKWNENSSITDLKFTGFTGTYDANEHGVTVEGDLSNYTIKYSTDGENYNLTESPKYINVGKNTVYYKVTRDGYKDLTGSVEINISEATITEAMFKFEDETVTYDGKEHTIKSSGSGLTNATITFTVNKTNYTSLPKFTNAGTYKIDYKIEKANYTTRTGSATLTINKRPITVKAKDKTITYGDSLPTFDYEITKGSLVTGESLENINVSQLTNTTVGNYDITVSQSEGSNPNYNIAFEKGTFRIDMKEITLEVTINQDKFTYNGEEQKPTVSVKYNNEDLPTDEYAVEFTEDSTNVGDKQVKVRSTLGNYTFTDITKDYKINAKTIDSSMVTINKDSYVYDTKAKTPTITVKDGTKTLVKDTDYEITGDTSKTNVGNYTITVTGKGNYKESYPINWNITKGTIVGVTITDIDTTYDGQNHQIGVAIPENAKISYKTNTEDEYTNTNPSFKNAGNYTVYYKVEIDNNYEVIEGNAKVIIAQKDVTVTADDKSKVYGEDEPELSYTNTELVGEEKLEGITLTRETGNDAGTYTITVSKDTSKDLNYNITLKNGTFTINKKEVTNPEITITTENIVYTGNEIEPSIVVKDNDGNVIPDSEYTVSYSNNTNAGEGTITITNKKGGNYIVNGNKTFTINKKEVTNPTIEFDPTEYTYTGSEIKPLITVKDSDNTIDSSEYIVEYEKNLNVGTATIKVINKDGGNYIVNGQSTFEIKKKVINGNIILANEEEKIIYNGEEQKPEIIVKDENKEEVSKDLYKVTYSNNTNAGTATIAIESNNDNYTITGTKTFEIEKADITSISIKDNTVTYDGKEHSATVNGSITGGKVEYSTDEENYSETMPTFTNAGTYTVYYKVTKTNYNDLTGTAKVTINRKEISKDNATLEPVNKEMVVTGEEVTQDVIVKLGDTIIPESEYTVTFENNKKIGTATIKVTDKDGGNYEVVDTLTTTFEIIDKGVIEVVTPNIPNANGAKFVGTAEELISKIEFTKEEQTAKENGKNIDVYLEVKDISNSVSESDKKAIEEKLENDTIGLYLDINLLKQVEGQDATKITETKEPITITFEIPEKLINTDSNIIRTYKILRLHEGKVDTLDVTVNGTTATFKTDEFSTYALAYTDKDITKTDTAETTSSPKTGDNIIVYAVMFIISTLGIAVISANNKKTRRTRR